MFEKLINENESKTLEFKENTKSPLKIIRTVIAFANTAGGLIILGVEDKTKKVIGIDDILKEEERLTNLIADSIEPLLIPDIEIVNYSNKELLVIKVPYMIGPYYLKRNGLEKGAYIRLGSSSRLADIETIATLQRLAKQVSFDELPCVGAKLDELDNNVVQECLKPLFSRLTKQNYKSLDIVTEYHNKLYPTYGSILLFAKDRFQWFPDTVIRCVCFAGITRSEIIDQKDIKCYLIKAIDEIIAFINRHTSVASKIGSVKREDIPQYPPQAIREAVINAIVHTDYAMKGCSIQIAIFTDKIEITNPGGLPFGQTLENALSGFSKMRNRMIGRIFRELKLIEKLGSGLPRIMDAYKDKNAILPKVEEQNIFFRITLYGIKIQMLPKEVWEHDLLKLLSKKKKLSTNQIAKFWNVTDRAARMRLKKMMTNGLIKRYAKSKNDPNATYGLEL